MKLPRMTPVMLPMPPSTMMLRTAIDTEKLKSSGDTMVTSEP